MPGGHQDICSLLHQDLLSMVVRLLSDMFFFRLETVLFEGDWQSAQCLFAAMPKLKLETFPVPFVPSLMLPGQQMGLLGPVQ